MSESLQGGPAIGRGTMYRVLAWCRRNPVVAALLSCIILLLVTTTITNTLFAWRLAEAERENQELRRELESRGKATPPRAVP